MDGRNNRGDYPGLDWSGSRWQNHTLRSVLGCVIMIAGIATLLGGDASAALFARTREIGAVVSMAKIRVPLRPETIHVSYPPPHVDVRLLHMSKASQNCAASLNHSSAGAKQVVARQARHIEGKRGSIPVAIQVDFNDPLKTGRRKIAGVEYSDVANGIGVGFVPVGMNAARFDADVGALQNSRLRELQAADAGKHRSQNGDNQRVNRHRVREPERLLIIYGIGLLIGGAVSLLIGWRIGLLGR